MTIITMDSVKSLQWLAEQGATFALPFGRSKGEFPKGWQKSPHTLTEAITHAQAGGNVGILVGKQSGGIVAIDRDVSFPETVAMLGEFAKTAKIVRSNAPERGKLLYRVLGELPPSNMWKADPTDKHPACEFLSDYRHALVPPSIINDGCYNLIDDEYGIQELTVLELDYVWRMITGESIHKDVRAIEEATTRQAAKQEESATEESQSNREYIAKVKEAWSTPEIFKHFKKDVNGQVKDKEDLRILGNGGLMVKGDKWYCYSDQSGGGPLEAWAFCKWNKPYKPHMFWDVINSMAEAAGIAKPEYKKKAYTNGTGHTNGTGSHKEITNWAGGQKAPQAKLEVERRPYVVLLDEMTAKASALRNDSFIAECLHDKEEGDARLLDHILHGSMVYDHTEGTWYWYNNLFWEPDETWNIYQLTSDVLSEVYKNLSLRKYAESIELEKRIQAEEEPTQEQRDELKRVMSLSKAARARSVSLNEIKEVKQVLSFANSGLRLGIKGHEWDTRTDLLCTQNAVINLKTGLVVPPDPSAYIRTVAAVNFDALACCPIFEKSILEIFDGRQDDVDYVQRLLGYAMAGECIESDFPIWYGEDGRNGKEFILERIRNVLGEKLTGVVESELLLASKVQRGKNSSTEGLMVLRGRRIAWASETNEGRSLDLASMKDLSGGHVLTGRHNHGKQVEWKRTHTLILLTNHRPHVNSQALAEWDRVKLLEFPLSFVNEPDPAKPNQRKKDKTLGDRIDNNELPGVLNWLISGNLAWRAMGLSEPESVKTATAQYRADEDSLGHFLKECCVIGENTKCKPVDLYRVYVQWIDIGSKPMGKKTFYTKIEQRNFRRSMSMGIEYFNGIGVLA